MALLRLPGLVAELLRVVVDLAELPDHQLLLRPCCRGGLVSTNRCQLATPTGTQTMGQVITVTYSCSRPHQRPAASKAARILEIFMYRRSVFPIRMNPNRR